MQRICVLTYQCSHRKTFDTLCLLRASGYTDVTVYATPLTYKKKFFPLIEHRPELLPSFQMYLSWEQVILNFGYSVITIENYTEIQEEENTIFLVCGAGLLPNEFIKKFRVINSHPGYIPYARGLDALKWAIWEGQPIGVSVHLIGTQVDAGEVIRRELVTVKTNDTFHALAQRVYEMEVSLLVDAIGHINELHAFIDGGDYSVHRRMPHEIERQLLDKFESLKRKM